MDDLVAIGGALNLSNLVEAYSRGIFPWPQEGLPLLWFSPQKRGVLFFEEFHLPQSLQKFIKKQKGKYQVSVNQDFKQVMLECQLQKRKGQAGTWILDEMIPAYVQLHEKGLALSVEIWRDEVLVGGIYGVLINNVFSGESMFHKETNMSKLALMHLIEELKRRSLNWMDIQMVTPLLENFGGRYIPRSEYLKLIKK